jgi:hypothetical protein
MTNGTAAGPIKEQEKSEQLIADVTKEQERGVLAPEQEKKLEAEHEAERVRESTTPAEAAEVKPKPTPVSQPLITNKQVDPVTKEIEQIMSEDLGPLYQRMSPEQRQRFRSEGEKTAGTIRVMIEKTKVRIKSILGLLRKWLQLIPGVNKFFLEQEAKIKADQVIALHKKMHSNDV